jgi:hypothetical protein
VAPSAPPIVIPAETPTLAAGTLTISGTRVAQSRGRTAVATAIVTTAAATADGTLAQRTVILGPARATRTACVIAARPVRAGTTTILRCRLDVSTRTRLRTGALRARVETTYVTAAGDATVTTTVARPLTLPRSATRSAAAIATEPIRAPERGVLRQVGTAADGTVICTSALRTTRASTVAVGCAFTPVGRDRLQRGSLVARLVTTFTPDRGEAETIRVRRVVFGITAQPGVTG